MPLLSSFPLCLSLRYHLGMNNDSHAPVSFAEEAKERVDASTNHCFGCGTANPQSLRLKFAAGAEPGQISVMAKVNLTRLHEGPPGCIHGGIIATLLDEAMGKLGRPLDAIAMTRQMTVDYLRPSPLGVELTLVGTHVRRDGRKLWNKAELLGPDGTVLATATGFFLALDGALMERMRERQQVKG